MKGSRFDIILASGILMLAALIYLTNPFHTGSLDPRIRIYGFKIFTVPSHNMDPTAATMPRNVLLQAGPSEPNPCKRKHAETEANSPGGRSLGTGVPGADRY